MRRRSLLQVGIAGTLLLATAGLGLSLATPAWRDGRLSPAAREVIDAISRGVLQGVLPEDPAARATALLAQVNRIEHTIGGFPKPVQEELSLLLGLLTTALGRVGLTGLNAAWAQASTEEVQSMLQALRTSSLDLRQQTYQALRDITYAAYYADRSAWVSLGYRGPTEV